MTQQQGSNVNRSQRKESLTCVNSGIVFIWRKQIAKIFVHWFQDANPLWLISSSGLRPVCEYWKMNVKHKCHNSCWYISVREHWRDLDIDFRSPHWTVNVQGELAAEKGQDRQCNVVQWEKRSDCEAFQWRLLTKGHLLAKLLLRPILKVPKPLDDLDDTLQSGLQKRMRVEFKFRTYLNCRTYTVPWTFELTA